MSAKLEDTLIPLVENFKPIFSERVKRDCVIVDIKHNKALQEELWEAFANMMLTTEIDLFNANIHEYLNLTLPHIAFNIDSLIGRKETVKKLKEILIKYNTKFQVRQYLPACKNQEHIVHLGTPLIGTEFQVREVLKIFCEKDIYEPVGMDSLVIKPTKKSYYDLGIKDSKYNKIPYCEKCLKKLHEHVEFKDEILVYPCSKIQDLKDRSIIQITD